MLDNSIRELRRVAHNMMPESLLRFGLDTALRDFCTDLSQAGSVKVVYQSFGIDQLKPDNPFVISVYRIVQELVNNALKHAEASQVLVQITYPENKLLLTVEDNGKGIDQSALDKAKGIGWENIRSRVDYLKGIIDIVSGAGKGTSVNNELPVV